MTQIKEFRIFCFIMNELYTREWMCTNGWEQDHTFVHTSYLQTKCQPTELALSEQSKKKKKRPMMESLLEPQRPQLFHHAQSNKTRKVGVVMENLWKNNIAASTIEIMWASNHHFTIHWKSLITQFGWTTTELPRFRLSDLSYKPSYLPPSHYLRDD